MVKRLSDEANAVLDEIIAARRTNRAFAEEAPPREAIEELIKAGLEAPYAALAVAGRNDFRRFFVFTRGTPAMVEAGRLIQQAAGRRLEEVRRVRGREAVEGDRDFLYMDRLKALAESGLPSLRTAPYFIVVAEYQGVPAAGLQSLAHALENMWLKATALGLAFQLISATETMAEDEAFVRLLGLPIGDFVLDGCAVGWPAADPPPARRPEMSAVTRWL
ncbi:MAG TPA: nitroreductase family protein [Terriglobales bacterium]|nr:nitroreductase family protein [Terriglobales bacterium]